MGSESTIYDEPADAIVEMASKEGVTISRRQLAEWHRAGLIPTPKQPRLGRGKGSLSIYPHGTLRQAIACSALMAHFGEKDWVGWELWVRRYPVTERHWREPLSEAHAMFRRISSEAIEAPDLDDDGPPVQSDAAEEFIADATERPKAPPLMGLARRRLGREGFKAFLGIVVSTAIGSFKFESSEGESADPAHVMARLVGTVPAKHKAAVSEPSILKITGEAIAANLEAMAEHLPQIASSMSPDFITEAELASARDELIFLLNSFLSVRENEKRIAPGSTPDLALITQILRRLGTTEQAALLLIWLAVRSIPGWREKLEVLRQGVLAKLRNGNNGGANAKPQLG
jgi:hypothetical protein